MLCDWAGPLAMLPGWVKLQVTFNKIQQAAFCQALQLGVNINLCWVLRLFKLLGYGRPEAILNSLAVLLAPSPSGAAAWALQLLDSLVRLSGQ